jgi:hypothetical protein
MESLSNEMDGLERVASPTSFDDELNNMDLDY